MAIEKNMSLKIEKIGIANRGEVAVRIIRACQELGIQTVLLHSDVDRETRAFRLADERVCIGPAPTNQSYLNIDTNIQGALSAGVDAKQPTHKPQAAGKSMIFNFNFFHITNFVLFSC